MKLKKIADMVAAPLAISIVAAHIPLLADDDYCLNEQYSSLCTDPLTGPEINPPQFPINSAHTTYVSSATNSSQIDLGLK